MIIIDQKKLSEYRLTASLHTLSAKTQCEIDTSNTDVMPCISATTQSNLDGTKTTSMIINPNRLHGDIYNYPDFQTTLETIMKSCGVPEYKITRADLRLDSFESEDYKRFAKLNKYLISAFAVTYRVRNSYKTTNLFTNQLLSIAVKNERWEIENYDKDYESEGRDAAKSRLELRSKRLDDNDLSKEFCKKWDQRWNEVLKHLDDVQEKYNNELLNMYVNNRKDYYNLSAFLMQYQDCIFARKQLINLLSQIPEIGAEKAERKADNHKRNHPLEFFSQNDVKKAISEIKRATLEYF